VITGSAEFAFVRPHHEIPGHFHAGFLQVVALFYLITSSRYLSAWSSSCFPLSLVVIQLSYWLTLSQFMTGTDLFLALTVSGDHRLAAILSFFKPLVFLYALPYLLVLSVLIFVPSGYASENPSPLPPAGALSPRFKLRPLPPRAGTQFPSESPDSFLRSALQCKFESLANIMDRGTASPRSRLPSATRQHHLCHRRVSSWQQSQPERATRALPHRSFNPSKPGAASKISAFVSPQVSFPRQQCLSDQRSQRISRRCLSNRQEPDPLRLRKKWGTRRYASTSMKPAFIRS